MRELFIDIENSGTLSEGLRFRYHEPIPGKADSSAPQGSYQTVVDCGNKVVYRYYRGMLSDYTGERFDGNPGEYVGVAVSSDNGLTWRKPELNFFPGTKAPADAVVFGRLETHNFCPFLDKNPACPPRERFKAVAGISDGGGLRAFYSSAGFHWTEYRSEPVIGMDKEMIFSFDSQNVAFYSMTEQKYLLFYRVYKTNLNEQLRAVARAESDDFIHWRNHTLIDMNRSGEHLYVSLLAPYVRAPQILVGTPTRFFEERGSATDITLVFSRDGYKMLRPFPEAWIRPGMEPERWRNRANYLAWNILYSPEDAQLSLFHCRAKIRYTLRADGFTSLYAGAETGEWKSWPLEYTGETISFNVSTSTGGGFTAALLDESGKAIPGFGFEDCELFYGDKIDVEMNWRGGKVPLRKGQKFFICCRFSEADFYSFTR